MAREPTEFLDTFGALLRALAQVGANAYASLELGSAQAKFLRRIGETGHTSQVELARATGSDPTLTGRVMQALLERGLVRRKRSEEDRREYVVELTPEGRRLRERVLKQRTRIAERLVGALDERDLDDFYRIAGKLLAAIDAR